MRNIIFIFSLLFAFSLLSCEKEKCPTPQPPIDNPIDSIIPIDSSFGNGLDSLDDLLDVFYVNSSIGYISGAKGVLYKTTDGGHNFTKLNSGVTVGLCSIWFTSASTGFTVGDNATILKTTDGGLTWQQKTLGSASFHVRDVYFLNSNRGFIVSNSGILMVTKDGGNTWQKVTTGITEGLPDGLYAIQFIDSTTGYVGGKNGIIIKTIDAGNTWNRQSTPISGGRNALNDFAFLDAQNGFICGGDVYGTANSFLLKTTNGGGSWTQVSQPAGVSYLTDVEFINANKGYVMGGNVPNNTSTVLQTNDGGQTWSILSSNTSRLSHADLVDGKIHVVGYNGSYIVLQ